jgi:hypothetical protein
MRQHAFLLCGAVLLGCRDQGPPAPATPPAADDEPEGSQADDAEGDDPPPLTATIPQSAEPPRARFLAEIRREISIARTTRYSHETAIDEAAGSFALDCSGFVDYALSRSAPAALAALPTAPPKHPRPRAQDFVRGFVAGAAPWQRLARVADLEPGDVVAWMRPADSTSRNTGHVMVVDGPPRAVGESEWAVPIADSTASRHGASDSRAAAKTTGIGRGTIVLAVDAGGAPTAFRWSTHTKRAHATTIALGRIASQHDVVP